MESEENRVVLFSVTPLPGGRLWSLTDCVLDSNGNVRICSGDGRREWHVVIRADEVADLRRALLRGLPDADANQTADVLALMEHRFAVTSDGANPYSEIVRFVQANKIEHHESVW